MKARLEDLTVGGLKSRSSKSTIRSAVPFWWRKTSPSNWPSVAVCRAIKKTLDQVMESGVYGVKVQLSGRLGGAEMSRCEKASRGVDPAVHSSASRRLWFHHFEDDHGSDWRQGVDRSRDYNSEEANDGF